MSLADDLLELAKKMARYKKQDLRDARRRRAVSTTYYALFHLLSERGSARIVAHSGLQQLVGRTYTHADMYNAAKSFTSGPGGLAGPVKAALGNPPPALPAEIGRVAAAFRELQEGRHQADYDLAKNFTRADAQGLVAKAEAAFVDWNAIDTTVNGTMCDLFLAALLLGKRWER